MITGAENMNKKDRVYRALRGEPVDRVPVTFCTHFANSEDNTVKETVKWTKESGVDLTDVGCDGFYALWSEKPLKTIEDWLAFRPYRRDDPFVALQVDRAKRISEALQDDASVFCSAFTPMSNFKHTLGEVFNENQETLVMEFWNEHRKDVLQVLKVLEETNFILLEALSETGADGVGISLQQAERWRFSREDYQEYMLPFDQRLLDFAKEHFRSHYVHLCSWGTENTNESIYLDLYQDLKTDTINWGVHQRNSMSMHDGRAFFKNAKAVMGGFDRSREGVLYKGSRENIKRFTKDLIRETGDQGFILSADCSIAPGLPTEHIQWVVEAAEEYAAENR